MPTSDEHCILRPMSPCISLKAPITRIYEQMCIFGEQIYIVTVIAKHI